MQPAVHCDQPFNDPPNHHNWHQIRRCCVQGLMIKGTDFEPTCALPFTKHLGRINSSWCPQAKNQSPPAQKIPKLCYQQTVHLRWKHNALWPHMVSHLRAFTYLIICLTESGDSYSTTIDFTLEDISWRDDVPIILHGVTVYGRKTRRCYNFKRLILSSSNGAGPNWNFNLQPLNPPPLFVSNVHGLTLPFIGIFTNFKP